MKRYFLVLAVILLASGLNAQTLFVTSNNAAVTGAVTSELMLELKDNDGRPLRGNSFICHVPDGNNYIIAISLENYRGILTTTIHDILRTKPYWVNNLSMNLHSTAFTDEIHITFPYNGRNYTVKMYIGFPG